MKLLYKTTEAKRRNVKIWRSKHPDYQRKYREANRPVGWTKGKRRSIRRLGQ